MHIHDQCWWGMYFHDHWCFYITANQKCSLFSFFDKRSKAQEEKHMMSWKWQHNPYCFSPQGNGLCTLLWLVTISEAHTPFWRKRDAFVWWWQGECQTKQCFSSSKPQKSLNVHTELLWSADSYASATSVEYIWIAVTVFRVVKSEP